MSKVVTYFRLEIPRILINRNIVRVQSSTEDDDFLFDACLLGNCGEIFLPSFVYRFQECKRTLNLFNKLLLDDVVEALGPRMKGLDSKPKLTTELDRSVIGSMVLNNEVWLYNHPRESVLLFPGSDVTNSCDETYIQQREIVHCDSCQQLVVAGSIYCCKICFDYDLCATCYPAAALTHADGSHEFRVDRCFE